MTVVMHMPKQQFQVLDSLYPLELSIETVQALVLSPLLVALFRQIVVRFSLNISLFTATRYRTEYARGKPYYTWEISRRD